MSRVKYSCVIPTKNRAQWVGGAIASILDQTYEDFEVIVVDNDESDATRDAVGRFSDNRLHYVRTGGLGMPQNWQAALAEARGEWVLFIGDKWRARKNLLELIESCLMRHDTEVVSWRVAYDNGIPGTADFYASSVSEIVCNSMQYLTYAAYGSWGQFADIAPRLANCAIRRSLIERSCVGGVSLLCRPASPDYTSGYYILGVTEEFIHLDATLVNIDPSSPSNGSNTYRRVPGCEKVILEMGLSLADSASEVPVKYFSFHNSLTNDYVESLKRMQMLDKIPLHVPNYFLLMADEAIRHIADGVPFAEELSLLRAAYRQQSKEVRLSILRWNLQQSLKGYGGCPDKVWTRMAKALKRQIILSGGIV